MNLQTLETLSWIAGVFAAVLALLATVDQLSAGFRRRRNTEFWQHQIDTAPNETDERTFHMLHRQNVSKIVASSWIPTYRAYFPIAVSIAGLWGAWDIGYRIGALEPANLTWTTGLTAIGDPIVLLFPLLAIPAGINEVLTLVAQRAWVRKDFLAGREVSPPSHLYGSGHVLWTVGGTRGTLGPLIGGIGIWMLVSLMSYTQGFRKAGYDFAAMPVLAPYATLLAPLCLVLGFYFALPVITANRVYLEDLYPPHGLPETERRALLKEAQERQCAEQEHRARRRRRAPWKRKPHWSPLLLGLAFGLMIGVILTMIIGRPYGIALGLSVGLTCGALGH